MHKVILASAMAALGSTIAACGGGGGGTGYGVPTPVATAPPHSTGFAGDAKTMSVNGQTIFVDATSGLALYTFNGDSANQSNCTGGCLAIWPAHAARSGEKASGNFTIFTRGDGSLQWAYKSKPLYTFATDTVSHNATGNGFQGFSLATP